MNTDCKKMGKLQFWARLIAWLGAFVLLTATIWEIIKSSNSLISISYWIFPIATYITGIFDIFRSYKKMENKKRG